MNGGHARSVLAVGCGLGDPCGRLVAVALTPGNVADITMAQPLLEALAPSLAAKPRRQALAPCKRLIADKAYDADRLRGWLDARGVEAVIPARATRASVHPINKAAYRRRNVIERMIGRIKNWKRIATRYDRIAINFMAAIALVALATQ
jgi:transposase